MTATTPNAPSDQDPQLVINQLKQRFEDGRAGYLASWNQSQFEKTIVVDMLTYGILEYARSLQAKPFMLESASKSYHPFAFDNFMESLGGAVDELFKSAALGSATPASGSTGPDHKRITPNTSG